MGIASLVIRWPDQGIRLPHLINGVHGLFGIGLEPLLRTKLLAPSTYFRYALDWRPDTLGFQEYVLAALMEPDEQEDALRVLEEGLVAYPNNWALRKMNQILSDVKEGDNDFDLYARLLNATGSRDRPLDRNNPRLTDFILQSGLHP